MLALEAPQHRLLEEVAVPPTDEVGRAPTIPARAPPGATAAVAPLTVSQALTSVVVLGPVGEPPQGPLPTEVIAHTKVSIEVLLGQPILGEQTPRQATQLDDARVRGEGLVRALLPSPTHAAPPTATAPQRIQRAAAAACADALLRTRVASRRKELVAPSMVGVDCALSQIAIYRKRDLPQPHRPSEPTMNGARRGLR